MKLEGKPPSLPALAGSTLSAELPASVLKAVQAEGGRPGELALAVKSDLAPDGQFGEQWLLLDPHALWVIDRHNGTSDLRYRFPLDQIQDARVERCVGNGLMQITVDQQPHVLLHYSNELTDQFGRVAHYLHERAEQGADVPIPDPHADSHHCLSCGRFLADPSAKVCPNCIQRGKILKRLLLQARPFWGRMGVIVVFLVAGVLVDLLPPYLTRILIDDVLGAGARPDLLIWLVGGLMSIQLIRVGITIVTNWLTINVSTRFTSAIRDALFAHLKKLTVDSYDKNEIGRLITRVNQDTGELQGIVSQLTTFALNIMLVVGIGIVLFGMAPSLGLYVLIPTPFVVAATFFYYRYMRPHFNRFWIARWRLNAMLNTFLAGVRVVKAFAQEDVEEERYHNRNSSLLRSNLQVDLAWSKFYPLISFAFGMGGLLI